MLKKDVIDFFNSIAPDWDARREESDEVINRILDNARLSAGQRVMDVACGTGVLFPFYMERGVKSVTGVDISPVMADIARRKAAAWENVTVLCADVMDIEPDGLYDFIMIYNAFPHFPDPAGVIGRLSGHLAEGGRLTVAHGMSRDMINDHHRGAASKVSNGLITETEMKKLFEPYFDVDIVMSDEELYEVSGIKK